MPSPKEFAHAFGIHPKVGDETLGIVCLKLNYSHEVIEPYKTYHIPFRFVFQSKQSMTKTLEWCKEQWANQEKVVHSKYGNPYKCVIEQWTIEKQSEFVYLVTSLGIAKRIKKQS